MIYHIYIMYCVQYKLEGECPYYQPARCDFTKYFYFQCYLVIIETPCITKSVMCGIVLIKNVRLVFTLKQIYFSFPAQTAVLWDSLNNDHLLPDIQDFKGCPKNLHNCLWRLSSSHCLWKILILPRNHP